MLIGIVGRRRSGKDTAASALMDAGFVNIKFAGALKAMLTAFFQYVGYEAEEINQVIEGKDKETPLASLQGRTCRYAMQTLGTEWGRNLIHQDLWVDTATRKAVNHQDAVISDVRYANEVSSIRAAGGYIIKIVRPGKSFDTHTSETETDHLPFDFHINNDETIDALRAKVLQIVNDLKI